MDVRGIRLHRHPAIDLSALAGALVAAFLFLRLAGAHADRVSIPKTVPQFDGDSAFLATRILAQSFGNRVTGSLHAQDAAAYIAARFRALGLRPERQDFPIVIKSVLLRGSNIFARSRGREPGTIIVLAHYDGQTTSDQSAGDNAAGVAALLELARVLEHEGHHRTIVYFAADATEWGMAGSRHFIELLDDPRQIVAAISLDHIENGPAGGILIGGEGIEDDYAPLWLRRAAAEAFRAGSVRTSDVGTLEEWIHRTLGVTLTDQGPFIDARVPAINLEVESRRPDYATFLYHTPGDRWETLDRRAFPLLGIGTERMVTALDAAPRAQGPMHYLGLGGDRMVKGWAILLAAIALFIPLGLATWEAWEAARSDPASRLALRSELVRAGGWWLVGVAGLLATWSTVRVGLLPEYDGAPPAVRDPFLYSTRWLPVLAVLAIMVVVGLLLNSMRRRPGLTLSHPLAGRATALTTLLLVVVVTILQNPFAAVWLFVLAAWLWPWIGPTRHPLTGAASGLIVLVSAVPLIVAIAVLARPLNVGVEIGWYLFLQVAYGTWSSLTVVMFVVMLFAAFRLVGTATARLLPSEGD
ncbi:MAG TPA: M28 family peptidase [Gemmatimonadales bacterium]|nr:M28 family peptidase [Gemmatimonadales bacterium]